MQPDMITTVMSEQEKADNRAAIVQAHSLLARLMKAKATIEYNEKKEMFLIRTPMKGIPAGWNIIEDHVLLEAIMRAAIKMEMITKEQAYGVVEAKSAQCNKCGWLNGKHAPTCWGRSSL